MKIDINELRKREEYIACKQSGDLLLWSYKPNCQYDGAWDEYTSMARGLITTIDGTIVARPFKKFFNLNEREETKIENLPNELPEITEKMDGSLGILYKYNKQLRVATRGSFNSEQAEWATLWINSKFFQQDFNDGYTYLFEIIYPQNRIVVDYGGRTELVLLAVINNETGEERNLIKEANKLGLTAPTVYTTPLDKLIKSLDKLDGNKEGFVCKYSNGFRVKMKGEEYKRLHRILTGFSSRHIWEYLKDGKDFNELLEKVPDEFYVWVHKNIEQLNHEFSTLDVEAYIVYNEVKELPTRKQQALKIMKLDKLSSGAVFALLDNRMDKYKEILWMRIKPKYEQPFKKDIHFNNEGGR